MLQVTLPRNSQPSLNICALSKAVIRETNTMRGFLFLLFVATVSAEAPLFKNSEPIPGKYIVILKDGFDVDFVAAQVDGQVGFTWKRAIKGFAVQLSDKAVDAVRNLPGVEYVEEDGLMRATSTCTLPWGLDRIDQRALPLDGVYQPSTGNGGTGYTAWMIDSGVRATHAEFGARAHQEVNFANGENVDCYGHGTHCAGIAGGSCVGVAPNIQIRGVKVLGCMGSGTTSAVITGVNYVMNNTDDSSVAALAVSGSSSLALDTAVNNLVISGVPVAVSAGNDNVYSCNVSPCRASEAVCVGASDSSDKRASYSNWGICVAIFAPGNDITSAWHTSDTAYHTMNGASLSTCHVAGALSLYGKNSTALLDNATKGVISEPGGINNHLLYV